MALHKVYGRLPRWLRTYTYWKITQQRCIAVDAAARLLNTADSALYIHLPSPSSFVQYVGLAQGIQGTFVAVSAIPGMLHRLLSGLHS